MRVRNPWLLLYWSWWASSHIGRLGWLNWWEEVLRGPKCFQGLATTDHSASLLRMQIFNKSFGFTVWGEVCFKHAPSHTNKRLRNLWLRDRLGRGCVIMASLHLWRLKGASGILGRSGWGSFAMRGWQRTVRPRRNLSSSCGTLSICSPIQNEAFSPHRYKIVPFLMQMQFKNLGSLGVSTLPSSSTA